ncbi:hypothetical protein [Sulfurovum mangrovi]|uniref:hypothetical protein n=1 Tax=Sulfurovum mangrovi TaxID=2893889 RepID=UPI001E2F3C08|nr:hypothetical protein [Sulfurovum mangrovi]UFH58123.1 hypothetical protein LN246_07135 [Sulfurovum mangrovi]
MKRNNRQSDKIYIFLILVTSLFSSSLFASFPKTYYDFINIYNLEYKDKLPMKFDENTEIVKVKHTLHDFFIYFNININHEKLDKEAYTNTMKKRLSKEYCHNEYYGGLIKNDDAVFHFIFLYNQDQLHELVLDRISCEKYH